MRIVMLNPPFLPRFSRSSRSPAVTKSSTLYYPLWLAYATGVLEKDAFQVKLIDAPARGMSKETTAKAVADFNPDLLVVDTSTPSIANDCAVAVEVKKRAGGPFTVLVGTHPSALPTETLDLAHDVNAVARREYDETLLDLARALDSGRDPSTVLGLSLRRGKWIVHTEDRPFIEDLDNIPLVTEVYSRHLRIEDYFYAHCRYPTVSFFTGRGCPGRCTFCVYPQTFFGRKYRHRSPDNIVEEFLRVEELFPQAREVLIDDDTFTINQKHVIETCRLMVERGVSIPWTAEVRVDLRPETMEAMKKAGCRLLVAGFESGSQEVLDFIRKGTTVEKARQFAKDARKAGLLVHGCFMAGNPGDSLEALTESLRLAKALKSDTVQFFPLMVYPGTEAYNWAKENGYLVTDDFSGWLTDEGMHNCVVSRPDLTNRQVVDFCDSARRSFYLDPRYLLYQLGHALRNPREFGRLAKGARSLSGHLLRRSFREPRSDVRAEGAQGS